MPYVAQSWIPGNGGGTPLGATRMNHIEAGLVDHETRVTALEADSAWVDITVNATFAAISVGEKPQVRLKRGVVYARGGWSGTGITASQTNLVVGSIPVGYRPPQAMPVAAGANVPAATGVFVISTNGDVILRTTATVGTYYKLAHSWLLD